MLALCEEQHTPGWFQQHGSRLPQQLVMLINHENKAVAISGFQEPGVSGLLQTVDYARAMLSRSGNVRPTRWTTEWPPGWPAKTLRVVLAALGAHATMTGAFTFMEFAEFRPVMYLESTTSCLFLEKPVEIDA